jgi:hypothetical protein
VSLQAALAGGLVGTAVLTTALRGASELGWTRMDLPFLLGTAVTEDRERAKAAGYALHFGFGLLFSVAYWAVFSALGTAGWWQGALLGLVHGAFAAGALVDVLLPAVHPRLGSGSTAADRSPLLEPPGFLLLNYGRSTPAVALVAHIAYGAIVGLFVGAAG